MPNNDDKSRIQFGDNTKVDLIKVYRDVSLTFDEAYENIDGRDTKTVIQNNFKNTVIAYYYASDQAQYTFSIYRRNPSQKYYEFVCDLENGSSEFIDYNITKGQFYHYLTAVKRDGNSYLMYENLDDNGNIAFLKANWDNWSICDIEETTEETVYYKTGSTWLLGYNSSGENVTQNTNVMAYDTLGRYNKFGLGKKNYDSSTFSCLLGDIGEVKKYVDDANSKTMEYIYTERDNPSTNKYAREVDKLVRWKEFCYNGKLKLLKDFKGNAWVIQIMSNPTYDINVQSGSMPTTISFEWREALNVNDISIIAIAE